eukprot:8343367-Karenia_brevis.AAC.1
MGHNTIVKKFIERGVPPEAKVINKHCVPPEPKVINKHWVDVAMERWGEKWGLIEQITISTTNDYMDTHLN